LVRAQRAVEQVGGRRCLCDALGCDAGLDCLRGQQRLGDDFGCDTSLGQIVCGHLAVEQRFRCDFCVLDCLRGDTQFAEFAGKYRVRNRARAEPEFGKLLVGDLATEHRRRRDTGAVECTRRQSERAHLLGQKHAGESLDGDAGLGELLVAHVATREVTGGESCLVECVARDACGLQSGATQPRGRANAHPILQERVGNEFRRVEGLLGSDAARDQSLRVDAGVDERARRRARVEQLRRLCAVLCESGDARSLAGKLADIELARAEVGNQRWVDE